MERWPVPDNMHDKLDAIKYEYKAQPVPAYTMDDVFVEPAAVVDTIAGTLCKNVQNGPLCANPLLLTRNECSSVNVLSMSKLDALLHEKNDGELSNTLSNAINAAHRGKDVSEESSPDIVAQNKGKERAHD